MTSAAEQLRDAAFVLRDRGGARMVPAPIVKMWLDELAGQRIPTPAGVSLPAGDAGSNLAHAAWDGLREPLRLKAFGPGLVSRDDPGSVVRDVQRDQMAEAIYRMGRTLSGGGHLRHGYLIEEQQPDGVTVSISLIRDPDDATLLTLAVGRERLTRPCPISRTDGEQLADILPDTAGRDALIEMLLAVAGAEASSVAGALGDVLLEFECDPVVVTQDGVCAVDTRLILAPR